jgi:hypothetical protein
MKSFAKSLALAASLSLVWGLPHPQDEPPNEGPGLYTLTAYAPDDELRNGLKVQYGGQLTLFSRQTEQYCPGPPTVPTCPKGTDTVFSGYFYPSSLVPGGQNFYVGSDGSTRITVQHSHVIPVGAYPAYEGWTWTPLAANETSPANPQAPEDWAPFYNVGVPSGYFTFKAPNGPPEYEGGVVACPRPNPQEGGVQQVMNVYAVTPEFSEVGCAPLKGLATHPYSGPNPPVWAYY